jgi:hypothetical protein
LLHGDLDQTGSHALAVQPCCDEGVEDKRMDAAVPGDVDEADKAVSFPRAHPAQAVLVHLTPPVIIQQLVAETLRVQCIHRDPISQCLRGPEPAGSERRPAKLPLTEGGWARCLRHAI